MKDPEHLGMMQDPETVSMKGTVFRVFLFVCETQCLDVIRYTLYFFGYLLKIKSDTTCYFVKCITNN